MAVYTTMRRYKTDPVPGRVDDADSVVSNETRLRALRITSELHHEPRHKPSTTRREASWYLVVPAFILGATLAAGFLWYSRPDTSPKVSSLTAVGYSAKRPTAPGTALIASGFVVARRQATVAADITGRVAKILVREGESVKKDQIVALLDPRLAQSDYHETLARIKVAKSGYDSVEAQLVDAREIFNRTIILREKGFASNASVTQNRARMASLEAQASSAAGELQATQSRAEYNKVKLANYAIRAPFDGVVIGLNAQVGEIVSPISSGGGFTRTGICTLVDMGSLELQVDVSESYISSVKVGQKGVATLDAYPDTQIPVIVIAIIPTVNKEKATVAVRLRLLEMSDHVLPNMSVKATLE